MVDKPILVKGREMSCGCEGPETPAAKQHAGTGEEPDSHALKTSAFWAYDPS